MKYITTLLVALSMALLCGVAVAHQDTRLKFDDGKITGLPESYLPASFDANELSVTIAGKKMVLPEVFQRLLKKDVSPDPFDEPRKIENVPCTFTFSASWYHAELGGDLPPYMLISISRREVTVILRFSWTWIISRSLKQTFRLRISGRLQSTLMMERAHPKKRMANKALHPTAGNAPV